MHLLILSLLMAFGGQIHIMAQVCIYQGEHRRARCSPNPSSATGPVTSITSGTLTGFSCPPEDCQPAHWECPAGFEMDTYGSYDHPICHRIPHAFVPDFIRTPYPLWRIEAQESGMKVFGPILTLDCIDCGTIDPIDLPAVQEKTESRVEFSGGGVMGCSNHGRLIGNAFDHTCEGGSAWSCADKSRSLESSVDGLKHWCHRMSQ